jgi:hypothetical protein
LGAMPARPLRRKTVGPDLCPIPAFQPEFAAIYGLNVKLLRRLQSRTRFSCAASPGTPRRATLHAAARTGCSRCVLGASPLCLVSISDRSTCCWHAQRGGAGRGSTRRLCPFPSFCRPTAQISALLQRALRRFSGCKPSPGTSQAPVASLHRAA